MAPPDDPAFQQLTKQVDKLAAELDRRTQKHHVLETYYDGESPMPAAIKESKLTVAYRRLMPVADAPWGSLIVDSVLDRLEVSGVQDTDSDSAASDEVWGLWQQNHMDSEALIAHNSGLISGRVFALVWPGTGPDQDPEISLDTSEQMVIQYAEGSRYNRIAALRRWKDADTDQVMATLYTPAGIYKFQQSDSKKAVSSTQSSNGWEQRIVNGEDWPVENPYNVVPVVEVRFNSRLKAGIWAHARGEYAHCLGLIDRINLLTFIGLVVAFWMGFPVRAVIGERILRDDDGNVIPPFDVKADSVVQLENPNVKLDSYDAADRSNLAIYPELSQLAAITKTPRHYFPLAQAMANLSADAIRADEGALNAKVKHHKSSAGEGWLEVMRLLGLMSDNPLSPRAQITWLDLESRSLAERAVAATQLSSVLPWQALAEYVLLANQDTIARWEAMRTSDQFSNLLAAAAKPGGGTGSVNDQETPETPETPEPPA